MQNTGEETRREQSHEDNNTIEQSAAGKDREIKSSEKKDTDIKRSEEGDRGYKSTEEEDRAMPSSAKKENTVHRVQGKKKPKVWDLRKGSCQYRLKIEQAEKSMLLRKESQRLQVLGEGSQGGEEESKATQMT